MELSLLLKKFGLLTKRALVLFICTACLSTAALSQSSLPPCDTTRNVSGWTNCLGSRTLSNGDKYSGEWKSGKYHGQGIFTSASGDQYAGKFREGKRHGLGTLAYKDGRPAQEGVWENNLFFRAESTPQSVASKAQSGSYQAKELISQPSTGEQTAIINWKAVSRVSANLFSTWRHKSTVSSIAFSPDGSKVITGSFDKTVVLRDVKTDQAVQTWQHGFMVNDVAFSTHGSAAITASDDKTAVIRDTKTGQTLQTWHHSSSVYSVAFSPDGAQVLTGSADKTAVLRDVKTGKTLQTWRHADSVQNVSFSPDGSKVVTSSSDKRAVLRDIRTGQTLHSLYHSANFYGTAFSSDGSELLMASSFDTISVIDVRSGQTVREFKNKNFEFSVTSIAYSPDGRLFLVGLADGSIIGYSIKGKNLQELLKEKLQITENSHRNVPKALAERQQMLEKSKPVKDEFEALARFNVRVAQWNNEVLKLNADIEAHYKKLGPIPLALRAKAFEEALSEAYGDPELHDIRYDPETARFFGTLKASLNLDFRRTVSIAVPNEEARAAKEILGSKKAGLEVELKVTDRNELIWGQPRFSFSGKVYVAQYTDKNFIPPVTTQLGAAPEFQTIVPPPMATLTPGPSPQVIADPSLAKLQVEVMQKEREQAEIAARQVEEKRLKARLAELDRKPVQEFKDDLPGLLAKLPVTKPNANVYVFAVGIDDYADVPDVPFADRSAKQFSEVAQKLFGAPKQNVVVLTNAEATSGRLRGRLRTILNRLGPQDQLLFYYAGHGVPGKNGRNAYLLAQDGGPGSYEEPDLQLEQLYAEIAKSRVGKAKLFIDACFSGRVGKDAIVFEGIAPITVSPKQSFPDSNRLAVLTAGRGEQFSNQSKERGHRLFSYHLMRGLLEGGSKLEMAQLHNQLRDRVLDESRRIGPEFEQEPDLQGNGRLSLN